MSKSNKQRVLTGVTLVGLLIFFLAPLASASFVAPPRDLRAENPNITTGISLFWVCDDPTSISGLELYRSVGDESNYILLSSMNQLTGNYQDRDITPDTCYYYKMRAYLNPWSGNKTVYSDFCSRISVRTPVGVNDPPAPTDLVAYLDGNTAVLTWHDNSENEDWFQIQRCTNDSSWGGEVAVPASYKYGTVTYRYEGLTPGTTNIFKVRASRYKDGILFTSPFSNYATATISPSTPIPGAPVAPTNLEASAYQKAISLTWADNSDNEDCFYLSRQENNGDWITLQQLIAGTESYKDWDVKPGTKYSYQVQAANHSGRSLASNTVTFVAPSGSTTQPKPQKSMILKFYINSTSYYVNDASVSMEVAPVIYHSRTMLPITYIASPIGAQTSWDETSGKITIVLNNTTIEMWLGSNTARVNNAVVPIDQNDQAVTPLVLPPGRTMVPLSFITQALGCAIDWNAVTQEVTISYFGQ